MSKIKTLLTYTKKYGIKAGINLIKEKISGTYSIEHQYRDFLVRAKKREESITDKSTFLNTKIDIVFYTNKLEAIDVLEKEIKKQSYKNIGTVFLNDIGTNIKIIEKDLKIERVYCIENIINKGEGEYIIFLEENCTLDEDFFYAISNYLDKNKDKDMVYADEDIIEGKVRKRPFFKPDISPIMLSSFQYIGSCFAIKRSALRQIVEKSLKDTISYENNLSENILSEGNLNKDNPDKKIKLFSNHWYDLLFHIVEFYDKKVKKGEEHDITKVYPRAIGHISYPLFSQKVDKGFDGFFRYKEDFSDIVKNHLKRIGKEVEDVKQNADGFFEVTYKKLDKNPLISILIPTKDHSKDVEKAMMSVANKSTYKNIEFILIENNSTEDETFNYYSKLLNNKYDCNKELQKGVLSTGQKLKIATWKSSFNYSKINNFGARFAEGDIIMLLNNDTEMISSDSIYNMVKTLEDENVGGVGAMLYYEDNSIQHGGVVYKIGGFAANVMTDEVDINEWYYPWKKVPHEMSACTAACLMIKKDAFIKANGLDEDLAIALNDVDLCLKIRKLGYKIVFNPNVKFHHYESKSRGLETESIEKQKRFQKEINYFKNKWEKELFLGDPYYNINLTLHKADYSVEMYEDNRGRYKF